MHGSQSPYPTESTTVTGSSTELHLVKNPSAMAQNAETL